MSLSTCDPPSHARGTQPEALKPTRSQQICSGIRIKKNQKKTAAILQVKTKLPEISLGKRR